MHLYPWRGFDGAIVRPGATADEAIAAHAAQQDGLVTWRQLRDAEVSDDAIRHRLRTGRLRQVHRGVFLVEHFPLSPERKLRAELLACGKTAVASHWTAAPIYDVPAAQRDRFAITVVTGQPHSNERRVVHRDPFLDARDVRSVDGIPYTSPARTLIDQNATLTDYELARTYDELRIAKLLRRSDLEGAAARAPGRRGIKRVLELIAAEQDPVDLRERAEELLHELITAAEFDEPLYNTSFLGESVDVVWPQALYVIEFDGFDVHTKKPKFERDRQKQTRLQDKGARVERVTWTTLTARSHYLVAVVARALALRSPAIDRQAA